MAQRLMFRGFFARSKHARCVITAAAIVVASCGGGGSASGPCDPVRTEPLASDWLLHVLPGAEASYNSLPPTSGPHIAWEAPPVLVRQLEPAEQVGILETGSVLIQYRPADIDQDDVDALVADLPDRAHLAPNDQLPAPVVFTAHLTKQLCSGLSAAEAARFAADHAREPVG